MNDHVSDEQLSLLLDGGLSLAAREAVLAHVRSCPACAERHDRLVELTATIRLAGRLDWTEQHTQATLARLHSSPQRGRLIASRPRGRDWSLPVAATFALAGIGALLLAPLGLGKAVLAAPASASGLFALALPVSGHVLALLAAAVALGLLAYPLSRSR